MRAFKRDIDALEKLYEGRRVFFGELHDHASTGGTSDGGRTLDQWLAAMEVLGLDFAAILDHRQVRHMYLPQWKDGVFLGGTEPGTKIADSTADHPFLHYNMIFEGPKPLEELLEKFEEFKFEGGSEGHFTYPKFTRERFCELISYVNDHGGFFVHPHPKQVMVSNDPLDYWFCDNTGIEVFYNSPESKYSKDDYKLWMELLSLGKRVWACAGGDLHCCASNKCLTSVFAAEKKNGEYLKSLRVGDFVCGGVAMKMCIGDTAMGSSCSFDGKRLVVGVDSFHESLRDPVHRFKLVIYADKDIVLEKKISCTEKSYVAIDCDATVKFYRAEVIDTSRDLRIAVGNPIWNDWIKEKK